MSCAFYMIGVLAVSYALHVSVCFGFVFWSMGGCWFGMTHVYEVLGSVGILLGKGTWFKEHGDMICASSMIGLYVWCAMQHLPVRFCVQVYWRLLSYMAPA